MGDETLKDVGKTFNLSRERVRQIEADLKRRIRAATALSDR
jgi:DNA-directed RNA polymerase sigma subunit (sigma70/sigma32)